jgi:hypothetical protein
LLPCSSRNIHGVTWDLKSPLFWDIMPCSPLKVNQSFRRKCRLHLQCGRISEALLLICVMLVSCVAHYLTLKMNATCCSENSVGFQQTAWCYIPEDRDRHNHRCENLRSYIRGRVSKWVTNWYQT